MIYVNTERSKDTYTELTAIENLNRLRYCNHDNQTGMLPRFIRNPPKTYKIIYVVHTYVSSVLTSPFKQGGPPSLNIGLNHFIFSRVIPSLFRYFESID